jgi:hypothetical protein
LLRADRVGVTAFAWDALPESFPISRATVHRRFTVRVDQTSSPGSLVRTSHPPLASAGHLARRYDRIGSNFTGFLHLAGALICYRR